MAKRYTGSLSLGWFNKQKSILAQTEEAAGANGDAPAPRLNWINKEEALFYEIAAEGGKGLSPYWVDRSDIRVKEARPLVLEKTFKAVERPKGGSARESGYELVESEEDDSTIENILIRGDNLLALNTLKKLFENRPGEEKVKCIYIDPPYNTGAAFEFYEDNLAHSEWLTLMRDRLVILRDLLRQDGFIFVQIDNKEVFRLKVLMDEVFGEDNFINDIIWKRRGGSANPSNRLNNVTDFILWYRASELSRPEPIYSIRDDHTQLYIKERFVHEFEGKRWMPAPVERNAKLGLRGNMRYTYKGYTPEFGWMMKREKLKGLDEASRLHWNEHGRPVRRVFLEDYEGQPITNLWTDIFVINPMSKERLEFDGQKPEALIERVLALSTEEGDLVLDCFGGAGTTLAVAQKMNRRWIGVEVGRHSETHIIPRLKRVLSGEDRTGISGPANRAGGGGFKYYSLGESVIDHAARDFNWAMGRESIERSLLSSYDFAPDPAFSPPPRAPATGFQRVGHSRMAGVVSLAGPEEHEPISYGELMGWYRALKAFKDTRSVTVFTNRGVELTYDSRPEDLEVIKVPHAIFAELEK